MLDITISTISLDACCKMIPMVTPIGVARAKINIRVKIYMTLPSKVFERLMPRLRLAAHLCRQIATRMLRMDARSFDRPRAIPSKIA